MSDRHRSDFGFFDALLAFLIIDAFTKRRRPASRPRRRRPPFRTRHPRVALVLAWYFGGSFALAIGLTFVDSLSHRWPALTVNQPAGQHRSTVFGTVLGIVVAIGICAVWTSARRALRRRRTGPPGPT